MLSTATKKKIDSARDILVGKIPMPTSQVEQITLALIYKFMADMDKKAKALGDSNGFFANGYEQYAWDRIMDKSLPARDRVKLYSDGLEKMSLNPHIPQLFRDIFRNAFLPFKDPETLKLFLDIIDQFEYDHSEELGNAFEYLLQVMGSQGDAGQFRTPRHIIDFIVDVVDPKKTDKILDPACGTAGFLISAYKHIKQNGLTSDEMKTISDNFVGYDISQDMQRLSLVNLYLHHFPDPHIYEYDTLTSEERWNDDFDVILANPPFMTPTGGIRPHNRFSVPSKRAEVLFVDYIMEHLSVNGRAGVIVPEGIIFQSQNAYKQLRKMMVDDDFLWAVVSLPSGIFQPYSGVKTSILLFDRALAKKTNKVLFIRANSDGFDLGSQRRQIKQNDLPQALKILKQYKQALTDGTEVNLEDVDVAHDVEKKEIRAAGYSLSGEGYKSRVSHENSDFEIVPLEEVAEINPKKSLVQKLDESTVVSFLPMSDLNENNPSFECKEQKTIGELYKGYTYFANDDVLLAKITPCFENGKAGIAANLTNGIGFGSTEYHVFRADKKKILPHYLYFMVMSPQFSESGKSNMTGSAGQKRVPTDFIKSFKIPLPPLPVQQEIVEELNRYQKIIDGAKQVVNNYNPQFKIEKSWQEVSLGSVAQISSGGTPSKSNDSYWEGDIPWVSPKDMKSLHITDAQDHISDVAVKESSTKLVPSETILCVVRSGILKHSLPVAITDREVAFNQDIQAISTDRTKLLPAFLLFYLIQNEKMILKEAIKPGVTVQSFHSGYFKNLLIPLPSIKEQQQIVNLLNDEVVAISHVKNLIASTESKINARIAQLWKSDTV